MSFMQRLLIGWLPKPWQADVIADSQRWRAICPCGCDRSIWELGGIRYRAAGNPRKLLRCPQSHKLTWHQVIWRADADNSEKAQPTPR